MCVSDELLEVLLPILVEALPGCATMLVRFMVELLQGLVDRTSRQLLLYPPTSWLPSDATV